MSRAARRQGHAPPLRTSAVLISLVVGLVGCSSSSGPGHPSTGTTVGPGTTRSQASAPRGRQRLTFRAVLQLLPVTGNPPTTPPAAVSQTANAVLVATDPTGRVTARYEVGPVLLNGSIIRHAEAVRTQVTGQWEVILTMTQRGSAAFDAMALAEYQRLVAIVLDDHVLSAPQVNAQHFNGTAQITGDFTSGSARRLAAIHNTPG